MTRDTITNIIGCPLCCLGLHRYEVLDTAHDGEIHRGLLRCKRCQKRFHAFVFKKWSAIMPLGEMAAFWGVDQ